MPTASYFGRNAFIQLKEEGTWGTAQAGSDLQRPLISCSMLRQVEKVERPNLTVSGTAGLRKGHFIVSDKATGSLSIEATYDNLNPILYQALGTGSTASATVNTHTFTMADVPASGLTMSLQRGTGQVEVFEGTGIKTLTLKCTAGEAMTLDADVIAQTSAARTTAITFTQPTNENLILHNHLTDAGLAWDSTNISLIDFEFSLENGLSERMRLGDLTTKQPTQADYRNAQVTVSFETDDATYAKLLADTTGDAVIIFDNGGAGSAQRTLTFTLHNAYISEYADEISETGLVVATVTLKGEGDGTDHGVSIAAYNVAANSYSDSA